MFITQIGSAIIGADRIPTFSESKDGPSGIEIAEWNACSEEDYNETVMDCRFENGEWKQ